MQTFIEYFGLAKLMPHGYCLSWNPSLLWLHVISDAVIALSYFSIPLSLIWFLKKRGEIRFPGLVWLFALFILACGIGHLLSVVIIWLPIYWIDGFVKLVTAIVSLYTAIFMYRIIPVALRLPGSKLLQLQMAELEKRDEAHLEALTRLKKIAGHIPGVVYQLRMDTNGGLSFPYASDALFTLTGLNPDEVKEDASKIFKLTHPDDMSNLMASIQLSSIQLSLWQEEFRIIHEDGSISWLLGKASPQTETDGSTLWHGFVTDITLNKQKDQALSRQQEELIHYFEQPFIGMVKLNHKQQFIQTNQHFCDIFGYSKEQMPGLNWTKITHPDDLEASRIFMGKVVAGKLDRFQTEKRYIHSDGHIIYAHVAVTCVRGISGVPDYFIGMVQDITEAWLTGHTLKLNSSALDQRVKELDALYAISELARNITLSHKQLLQQSVYFLSLATPDPIHASFRIRWNDEIYCSENFQETAYMTATSILVHGETAGSIQLYYFECCTNEINENKLMTAVANILGESFEHRLTATSLGESEKHFRNIFEFSPIGVMDLSQEGHFLSVNQTTSEILGYSRNELSGMRIEAVIHPDSRLIFSRYMQQIVIEGITRFSLEMQFICKNGSLVWGNLSVKLIFSGERDFDNIIAILEDTSLRKQAELEMLAARNQLQATINAIPDILLEIGLDGYIYEVHTAFSLPGTTPDKIKGKKIADIYPGEIATAMNTALQQANEKFCITGTQVKFTQDDKSIWFELSIARKPENSDQPKFIVLARDISERKDLEQSLLNIKQYYEVLIRVSPVGLFQTDLQGNCNFANSSWSKITGLSLEDSLDQGWTNTIHPDDRDRVMNTWNISLAMETECYQEFRYLLEDAQTRWVLAQSAPMFKPYVGTVGYIGTITDITVRKLAEIKYLQSELKFSQLLKIIPLSVMVCDVLSEISFINDRFEQLFGYGIEDITTLNDWWLQAFPDENYRDLIIGNVKKAIDRAVIEKTDIEAAEYTVVCKNGMQRIILFSGIVFDDSVIFVGVDVSERKKMELELQRSNAELEQFAYAVSHDMRQPLRMVSSFLPLIEDALAGQLNEETRQYLDFAVEGAKRMDAMIVSLLEYSRAGRTITANALISSRVVLDEVLAFLKPEIEATAASIEISGEWPNLTVNCDQLTRVFQNLIGNALKYHEENTPPQIKVVAHTDTRMFHFFVRDSGVGIDASQIPKLFKVFSRLHARTRFEGTGVGLALCRRIVENMGGSIGVESEGEGKGCTFWFELPL